MKSKLLRVTQLDAIQLDNDVVRLLKELFDNSFQYLPPGFTAPLEPEINLILRLLIFNYSLLKKNATFGQDLLLIKYKNLTNSKKILYILLSSLDYFRDRFNLSSQDFKYSSFVNRTEFFIRVFAFLNYLNFLRTGEKPNLVERVLDLDQVFIQVKSRKFSNKYMVRELLWNGFIELLVFVLPLINYHKLKRSFKSMISFHKKSNLGRSDTRMYNLFTRCAQCVEVPIHPSHMGCAHVFCYVCLKSNQLADPRYQCPLCNYSDNICERIAVL